MSITNPFLDEMLWLYSMKNAIKNLINEWRFVYESYKIYTRILKLIFLDSLK